MAPPLLIAAWAMASLALLAPRPAAAERDPFRVVNRTGVPATALHAVRTPRGEANDWGRNLLREPMAPDATFALRPTDTAGCAFDIRLVLADGRQLQLRNRDICVAPLVVAAIPAAAPGAVPGATTTPPQGRVGSGTGFVVARDRVLTNHHVVQGCARLMARTSDGRMLPVTSPATTDPSRDLALLEVPGDAGPPLTFRRAPEIRRGEGVVTYGFPLAGLLSSGPTLTTGEVSALSGLRDNPNQFQISAPVQPGNSGGPLLDRQGNVIGVVVAKLNAARIAERTGDIPQNVNFAVKGTEALDFLRRSGVQARTASSSGPEQSAAAVGEVAHRSTVFIRCER